MDDEEGVKCGVCGSAQRQHTMMICTQCFVHVHKESCSSRLDTSEEFACLICTGCASIASMATQTQSEYRLSMLLEFHDHDESKEREGNELNEINEFVDDHDESKESEGNQLNEINEFVDDQQQNNQQERPHPQHNNQQDDANEQNDINNAIQLYAPPLNAVSHTLIYLLNSLPKLTIQILLSNIKYCKRGVS